MISVYRLIERSCNRRAREEMRSEPVLVVLLFAVCLQAGPVAGEDCCIKVDSTHTQLLDSSGRARLFHGVNVVFKSFPYHPTNGSFDPQFSLNQQDIQFLVENGFSVVRLYVAWTGVEPSKGQYNHTYLDVVADFVQKLGEAGVYTILDCHQDLLSPKFCGEGVPDYAALYMNRSIKPLPFPEPIPSPFPFKVDPATGYPYRNECSQFNFFTYGFSDAVGKSWQSLYDNEQNIQDHFAMFWGLVAKRFANNPYVLGYELLNEPSPGDIWSDPGQLSPRVADPRNLMPMYRKLHTAIRKFDDQHIVLFEPTALISNFPFNFSLTGLTEGPGGPAYNDRQVYSYHIYCSAGAAPSTQLCDLIDEESFKLKQIDTRRLDVAGFITEFGAYGNHTVPTSISYQDGLKFTSLADQYLQSWIYWQFKGYGDFTTASTSEAEGLFFLNGTVQESKLKLLSRTYAKAVTGRYVNQTFDPSTGDFTLTFTADTTLSGYPSVVYLNEKFYYPNGYSVSVTPAGAASYSTAHNQVEVKLVPGSVRMGEVITVHIEAKKH